MPGWVRVYPYCWLFSLRSISEVQNVTIVIFHATCHGNNQSPTSSKQKLRVTSSRVSAANVSNLSVPLIHPSTQESIAPSTHQVLSFMAKGLKQLATMMGSFPTALTLPRWLPAAMPVQSISKRQQPQWHPDGDLTPFFARSCTWDIHNQNWVSGPSQ